MVWNSAGVLDERSSAEKFRYLPVRCADLSMDRQPTAAWAVGGEDRCEVVVKRATVTAGVSLPMS